ncbi:MAG: FAD-dependent oxidoreductase [Candidatus Pacebacteria bacterium]|nr:FAD-dependent oxidoreductase [Candidatus Paceibacterota bacterium]
MIYDVIIIGLGPAGISAGIYAHRQNLECLLIGKSFGGQMVSKAVDIENYPGFNKISGFDLVEKMIDQLKEKGIEYLEDKVVSIVKNEYFEIELDSGKKFQSKVVIVCTGAEPRRLSIEGEKEFLGKGVSYCTTCDGPLFRNKDVAIIGGGDAGFEAARFFSKYANKIYVIERGKDFIASSKNQEIVRSFYPKIETLLETDVIRIIGDSFVKGIECSKNNEALSLKVEGVFVQIGYVPTTGFLGDLVDMNDRGEIIVDRETLETKTPGLFAAGDVNDGRVKQIVVACSDGARASVYAYKYLNNK